MIDAYAGMAAGFSMLLLAAYRMGYQRAQDDAFMDSWDSVEGGPPKN